MSARYLSVLILILLLVTANSWGGEQEIGIFVQKEKDCSIPDDDGAISCGKGLGIRNGDIIITTRDPKSLNIQWISKEVKLEKRSSSEYQVVYTLPAEKSGIVNTVLDILGFAKTASRSTSMAATRGAKGAQPAAGSTLLTDFPVTFSGWESSATRLLIRDASGAIIREEQLAGRLEVHLIPEKSGLLAGQTYRWQIDGKQNKVAYFTILNDDNAAVVHDAFTAIDANAALKANDRIFAKASLALQLSENYPDEVTLQWLASQLTEQMSEVTSPEDKAMVSYLRERSKVH